MVGLGGLSKRVYSVIYFPSSASPSSSLTPYSIAIIPIATSPITITASTTATNNCTAARECSVTHTRVHANVPVNVRDRDDDEAKDKHDGGDK
jgi:hypothetical protein